MEQEQQRDLAGGRIEVTRSEGRNKDYSLGMRAKSRQRTSLTGLGSNRQKTKMGFRGQRHEAS